MTLLAVFEEMARKQPDSPAVRYFDETLSFGGILRRAEQTSAWLAERGIGPGDRVAIQMQNDPEFLIAQYGIWMRGAIAVPVSPMFTQHEVDYHVRDSGSRILLDRETVSSIDTPPSPGREPADEIAYLVYTSGTTGRPKGAMCAHRCMLHTGGVFEQLLQVTAADVILGLAPLFHVTGLVAHMALSARTGAPLVLFHRFDAATVWSLIERWRTTVTVASITAYMALLNHRSASRERFASMTKCFTGGAPVPPAFVERFERELGVYIHNTYGLTEVNSPSHITPLGERGPVDPHFGALSVGRPIPGCEARILEDGELALRRANVFSGYWQRPEATRDAFRDGWFLTGDIAASTDDGWYFIVDRKKDMINCSGFKVYPREVEDVLYQHEAVLEAAVVGVPDEYRGETVKAVLAIREGAEVTAAAIESFCRERLAPYKVPRQVEFLASLPKTATGKFLRRALRQPTAQPAQPAE
jgi:long-chain acyl-CoA synthetase